MIDRFTQENRFLSNFSPALVEYDGMVYPTTEHAYQAAKSLDLDVRKRIAKLHKPGDAKREGGKLRLRSDWESVKIDVMEKLVRQKFQKHKDLARKLLATGDEELVEGNNWNDTFWGKCNGRGHNHLGKILMRVRDELRTNISDY